MSEAACIICGSPQTLGVVCENCGPMREATAVDLAPIVAAERERVIAAAVDLLAENAVADDEAWKSSEGLNSDHVDSAEDRRPLMEAELRQRLGETLPRCATCRHPMLVHYALAPATRQHSMELPSNLERWAAYRAAPACRQVACDCLAAIPPPSPS